MSKQNGNKGRRFDRASKLAKMQSAEVYLTVPWQAVRPILDRIFFPGRVARRQCLSFRRGVSASA